MSRTSQSSGVLGRLRSLMEDNRGNVTVFFAFSIIPMLTAIGIGIDVANLYMARSKLQGALDAGALAGGQTYYSRTHDTEAARFDAAKDVALKYMKANVPELIDDNNVPTINMKVIDENNLLEFTAELQMKTAFSRFVGFTELDIDVGATVSAGQAQTTEIVLALDNTSSMFDKNRFVLMREAAKDFTNKLFNQTPDPTLLRISVVPWSTTINIKSERPDAPNANSVVSSKLVAAGSRLVPQAAVNSRLTYVKHPDTGTPFFSTAQVNQLFQPVEWRGCIRSADEERDVSSDGTINDALTDAPPSPMRWPVNTLDYRRDNAGKSKKSNCRQVVDNHSHGGNNNNNNNNDNDNDNDNDNGGGSSGTQASLGTDWDSFTAQSDNALYAAGDTVAHIKYREQCDWTWEPVKLNGKDVPWCDSNGENGRVNAYWPADEACSNNGQVANKTKKACVSDPNEFAYFGSGQQACPWEDDDEIFPWNEHKPIYGPNLNCPTAMLPLSSNRRQVIRKLDHMYPVPGGTHADVGLTWALRALSPRAAWTQFWGLGTDNAPMAFNTDQGRKVVVLLTDGKNVEASDYEGYWGCARKNRPGGIGNCWENDDVKDTPDEVLDKLMLGNCTTMKDTYGIELYTIAVDINHPGHIDLLKRCASSAEHAFNIKAAELKETFDELAQTNLRIVR